MINRDERRSMGMSKESADKINHLNSPCTVIEAVQLAQGVSKDAIDAYHKNLNPLIISLSLQLELLKEILESKGLLNMEEFTSSFEEKLKQFNEDKEKAMKEMEEVMKQKLEEKYAEKEMKEEMKQNLKDTNPKTDMKPHHLEIVKDN